MAVTAEGIKVDESVTVKKDFRDISFNVIQNKRLAGRVMTDILVKTTTTLAAGATYTSAEEYCEGGTWIIGTVYSDVDGTIEIQQAQELYLWYTVETISYTGGTKMGIKVDIVAPWFRIVYTNGATAQTTFYLVFRAMV